MKYVEIRRTVVADAELRRRTLPAPHLLPYDTKDIPKPLWESTAQELSLLE